MVDVNVLVASQQQYLGVHLLCANHALPHGLTPFSGRCDCAMLAGAGAASTDAPGGCLRAGAGNWRTNG